MRSKRTNDYSANVVLLDLKLDQRLFRRSDTLTCLNQRNLKNLKKDLKKCLSV